MAEITIDYKPRTVQREIHEALDRRRFAVVAAHRRLGKTVAMINQALRRALTEGRPRGSYGYVAPFLKQGKSIAWEYLKHFAGAVPGRRFHEQELFVELPNRARVRIFGADNPDALRGLYFDGVILDEVAQMKPEIWGEIIQPALADREGWAVFIGTPKGVNLFHEVYLKAERDRSGLWAALCYPIHRSLKTPDPPLSAEEVARLKSEMSENAFRQEFLCDFSASADDVLITVDLAAEASGRVVTEAEVRGLPLVLGVDVARFGSDDTVFMRRRGRIAYPPLVLKGLDNQQVSQRLVAYWHEHRPEAVFIDAGQGQGVIDFAGKLLPNVIEVPFGSRPLNEAKFLNRRAEMWYSLRQWLQAGGALPDDPRLMKELAAPRYSFNAVGKIRLEAKEEIVKRVGFSPDIADALALTFAAPVDPVLRRLPRKAVRRFDLYD